MSGDRLKNVGDVVFYIYDLGDEWRHLITLDDIKNSAVDDGAVVKVLDGANRCPDEDEGGGKYQTQILDLYNSSKADPNNVTKARKLSTASWDRINAMNVRASFYPGEFSVEICQEALRSRNWARNSVKMFGMPGMIPPSCGSTACLQGG